MRHPTEALYEARQEAVRKWDVRFLRLAEHVSEWSRDPSTKCGAVIVRGKVVVSVGFNGFAQGMDDSPEMYANREVKYSRIIHAEVNALLFAGRSVKGATLYTWPFICCDRCAVQMIQAKIARVVFPVLPEDKIERWGESMARSLTFFAEADVECVEIEHAGARETEAPITDRVSITDRVLAPRIGNKGKKGTDR